MANLVLVGQLTVAQAHQEFTKLVEQNFGQSLYSLTRASLGAVGTLAFDAKMHELAILFARMSQLCLRLGLFRLIYIDHLSSSIKWSISANFSFWIMVFVK